MSTYSVLFTPLRNDSRSSGLSGEGSIEVRDGALRVVAQRPRMLLIHTIAGLLAIAVTFFVLMFVMGALDQWIHSKDGDMRLFVAIGFIPIVGVFIGVRTVLLRKLPPAKFDKVVRFADILAFRMEGSYVALSTIGADLRGKTLISGPSAHSVLDEYNAVVSGPQGYRR